MASSAKIADMATLVPLDKGKLEPSALEFSEALFTWIPQWRELGLMYQDEGAEAWEFWLKVPGEGDGDQCELLLKTDTGEITVSFSNWHSHYEAAPGESPKFAPVLEEIRKIITDEAIVVWLSGPNNAWSARLVEEIDENFLTELVTDPKWQGSIHVVSFSGSKDDEFSINFNQ